MHAFAGQVPFSACGPMTPDCCAPACPSFTGAAIRQTQRGESDSEEEAAGRRRRRVRFVLAASQCATFSDISLLHMCPLACTSSQLPTFLHTRVAAPLCCAVLQQVPSPSGDPVEAARGGLRRGRSAAAIKE
jgi:hypothetical protein